MKLFTFHGGWKSIDLFLSIPLRMKQRIMILLELYYVTFNSFEDETLQTQGKPKFETTYLSIPLRMKPWVGAIRLLPMRELSIPLRMKLQFNKAGGQNVARTFQFLWGWNKTLTKYTPSLVRLSIPLRMKQKINEATVSSNGYVFQFLWGWNIEDISDYYSESRLSIPLRMKHEIVTELLGYRPITGFQFLWGWNWSTFILSFIL